MPDTTGFNLALNGDSPGWNAWTIVPVWDVASLTIPAGSITHVRFTFQGPAGGSGVGTDIGKLYVGHVAGSGDAYDFATTPTPVQVGGSNSFRAPKDGSTLSDWTAFVYNKTSKLAVAFYVQSNNTDIVRYKTGVSNVNTYYKSGDSAATVDKTGFVTLTGELYLVTKIEFRTAEESQGLLAYW